MEKKNFKQIFCGWTALSFAMTGFMLGLSASSFAGVDTSGGGPSIIKYDYVKNEIMSAQLLDLYEGPKKYNLNIVERSEPYAQQIQNITRRLKSFDSGIGLEFAEVVSVLQKQRVFLPDGDAMAPGVDISDSQGAIVPIGWILMYVGYYESAGVLKISKTIFDKMSETHKAALYVHEALYKLQRDHGFYCDLKSSELTRQFNAYLFDPNSDLTKMQTGLFGDCQDMRKIFGPNFDRGHAPVYILPNASGQLKIVATNVKGQKTGLQVQCNWNNPEKADPLIKKYSSDNLYSVSLMETGNYKNHIAGRCQTLMIYDLSAGANDLSPVDDITVFYDNNEVAHFVTNGQSGASWYLNLLIEN